MPISVNKWALCRPEKGEKPFKSKRVPSIVGRRCSLLSHLALDVALELFEDSDVDFAVFASRHGEVNRTIKLLELLAEGEELSPTAFAQSVHNTAAGLCSVIRKSQTKMSSIAAGAETFPMALVEAEAYLKSFSNHKVMLIYFDQELPEVYQNSVAEISQNIALGLVLEHSSEGKPLPKTEKLEEFIQELG